MTITTIHPAKAANGTGSANGTDGTDAIFTQNGKIGADAMTVNATGGDGGDGGAGALLPGGNGGKGGNGAITLNGNIFNAPATTSLVVSLTATGGDGGLAGTGTPAGSAGAGGNGTVTVNGNIIQPNKVMTNIELDAIAVGGNGSKKGNASATLNGNIVQPSKGATSVTLDASATAGTAIPLDNVSHDGDLTFGTKTATVNGNIVQGNISTVWISADAYPSNGTANLNGNIVQVSSNTATGTTVTLEASGNHISITNNKVTLGKQEFDLTVNEYSAYDNTINNNTFTGSGTNNFVFTDNALPGPHSDTVTVNLATNTFVFNGQSNVLTGFNSASVLGTGDPATLIGNDNNNTLVGGVGVETFIGGKGNDTLDGGNGTDTAVYSGLHTDYTYSFIHTGNLAGTVTDNVAGRDGSDTLQNIELIQFSDGTYNTVTNVFTPTAPLDVAPVVVTSGGPTAAQEQVPIAVDGALTVSDADSLNLVSATVSITGGFQTGEDVLSFTNTPNITGSYNSTTGVLTLTGSDTVAHYQAALDSVTYDDTSDTPNTSSRTISFQVNDGTLNSNIGTKTVNVTAVDDAPVATMPLASYSATEQVTLGLKNTGMAISDVDAGAGSVTATLSVTEGTLNVTAGGSGAGVSGSGTGTVILTGTLAQINALLNTDGTSTVSYIDNTDTPSPSATLSLSVNDNGNTGTGGPLTGSNTATINITAVDDAPVATITPTSYSVNEQTALSLKNNGLSISDVDAGAGSVTATLSVTEGTLNVTAGGSGAGVSGSGTGTVILTGTLAQINALLNTDGTSTVSYIDNIVSPTHTGTLSLSVNDNGNTGTGGPLTGSDSAILNINGGENYFGTTGNDTHTGTALDDLMHVSAGNDTLDGAANTPVGDTLSFDTADAGITYTINTLSPVYTVGGNPGQTLASNFENLTGSNFDDVLTGDSGTNVLNGGAGDDVLVATAGGDTLNGGTNGAGGDTADFSGGTMSATVNLNLQGSPQLVSAEFGNVTLNGIENLTGTNFGDMLIGDAGNNILTGGTGDDTLQGGAGDDTLDGGAGGSDTADYSDSSNGVVVNLSTGTATGDGNDTLFNIQNVTGSSQNDTLIGDDGDNSLSGGDGNDILYGHGGNNGLSGGNGTDVAYYYGLEKDLINPYSVLGGPGLYLVTGGPEAVNDAVTDVERLKFLSPSHVSDLNNDGAGDLVFQNNSAGEIQVNGAILTNTIPLTSRVVGTGQFNPDDVASLGTARNSDILVQASDGTLSVIYDINGTASSGPVAFSGAALNGTNYNSNWKVVSTGDFNGDASWDVLLQNQISGAVEIMFLKTDSTDPIGTVDSVGTLPTPGMAPKAIAVGDFNGDGKSDILWQNPSTKAVEITLMDGSTITNSLTTMGTANLTAVGTGDFNGDGFSDILFKNASGQAVIWFMYGDTHTGTKTISKPGLNFSVSGAEDVDGNGYSDIVWTDPSGNTAATTFTSPSSLVSTTVMNANLPLTSAGAGFQLIASTGGG